ncbi:MAG: energy-coupling factor transporter transmembrane protein EcfT [Clostridiaceae bacterium]|nr:energy-coupling factor transporter transmembrane protein EcfT [Clostridiaceae bacterium]
MIKDITLGQYFPGESILHKADSRVKIILTFAFSLVTFVISSYVGFLALAVFTMIGIKISKVPIRYTLKGLKPLVFVIAFSTLMNLLTTEGTAFFEYKFIKLTYEGMDTAIKLTLRLSLLIMITSLMTLTTTPISLTDGLEKLMNPLKKVGAPIHEFAMMMTIALRFIPTLLEETDKIMKAQASRGADFESGNIIQRAKSFIPVLVPLFVSAFRRADELAMAMEARCYRGGKGRTRMKQLRFKSLDFILLSVSIGVAVLLVFVLR